MISESELLDVAFTLLSDSRRRYLLYRLDDSDSMTTEELSLEIAAWERDVPVESVREDDRKRVETTLVHTHLPRLADHGILERDSETGTVETGDRFDQIRPLVERARATELDEVVTGDTTILSDLPTDGERPFSD
ncbi:hypothetical protein OB955_17660 [Halobacteria archaeon AArc-m2/3/4]|uniref:DUF7344 domain-containing protein n=1 Tax=Natronoglomus mannanivorans TaxID=2979990 RepID=A0AAP2YYA2_9EURY|nr:hypothetical protein [Halobacteria archaeon AArc-xg1-1]MCU4974549.1 hypothetical protein [Halobacteria archaeon AArc-m2/3/4]